MKVDKKVLVLHFDSLKGFHSSKSVFETLQSSLESLWLAEAKESIEFEYKIIQAPQQENGYDCGLFVLYSIEMFLKSFPESVEDLDKFDQNWYNQAEPSALRSTMKRMLEDEFNRN